MLSKLVTRFSSQQNITYLTSRAFRATPQLNKKPSIGDAVTILQSKVSNINQVVSTLNYSSKKIRHHPSWIISYLKNGCLYKYLNSF